MSDVSRFSSPNRQGPLDILLLWLWPACFQVGAVSAILYSCEGSGFSLSEFLQLDLLGQWYVPYAKTLWKPHLNLDESCDSEEVLEGFGQFAFSISTEDRWTLWTLWVAVSSGSLLSTLLCRWPRAFGWRAAVKRIRRWSGPGVLALDPRSHCSSSQGLLASSTLHCGHCGHCICNGSMAAYGHEILSLVVPVWQGLGKWESASKGFFIASHTCHVSLIGSALTERSVCIEACRVAHWPAVAEAAWLYGQAEETCSANMFWHVLRILDHFSFWQFLTILPKIDKFWQVFTNSLQGYTVQWKEDDVNGVAHTLL